MEQQYQLICHNESGACLATYTGDTLAELLDFVRAEWDMSGVKGKVRRNHEDYAILADNQIIDLSYDQTVLAE